MNIGETSMVMEKVLRLVQDGSMFETPSGHSTFKVEAVNRTGVRIRVGVGWPIRIPAECWEGIPSFLRGKGWVIIGATHGSPPPGSFDQYLQQFTHGVSVASYVTPILERIGIVKVNRKKPSKIRLIEF